MKYSAILENSIMQKDKPASYGSKALTGFTAPISATVVAKLESASIDIVGSVSADEFGAGGLFPCDAPKHGDNAYRLREQPLPTVSVNPCDNVSYAAENANAQRYAYCAFPAVDAIASDKADFALCNDYTGSIARAAAAAGLYYLHPTYGTVSRYGLIQAVSSMDQIGILCKSPETGFYALNIIAGHDEKDGASKQFNAEQCSPPTPREQTKGDDSGKNPAPPIFRSGTKTPSTCFTPCFPCLEVMQILCCAELSNNISRYDGIKFGYRANEYSGLQELYAKSRTESFGEDVKLAAIIGAMVLYQEDGTERYYDKAMKMRRIIIESFEFDNYDAIATCCPTLSRLCGFPALTTPNCTYIAAPFREDILMAADLK